MSTDPRTERTARYHAEVIRREELTDWHRTEVDEILRAERESRMPVPVKGAPDTDELRREYPLEPVSDKMYRSDAGPHVHALCDALEAEREARNAVAQHAERRVEQERAARERLESLLLTVRPLAIPGWVRDEIDRLVDTPEPAQSEDALTTDDHCEVCGEYESKCVCKPAQPPEFPDSVAALPSDMRWRATWLRQDGTHWLADEIEAWADVIEKEDRRLRAG